MANHADQSNNYYKTKTIPDEDTWVDDFANWVESRIPIYYVEDMHGSSASSGLWVEYEWDFTAGIYAKREVITLKDIIYEWLRANGLHLSSYYVGEALSRLKTKKYIPRDQFDIYDPKDPFINCKNGLWYPLKKKFESHTPHIKCLNQIDSEFLYYPSSNKDPKIRDQENFDILVALEKQMPCWMSMRKYYPFEMDLIERYAQMVLYQDIKHKIILFVVGGSNTGKSTVAHVLVDMFASIASYQALVELNEKWGMMDLIGKKVNFDLDSGVGKMNGVGLGRLKAIVGDPGKIISVPVIYKGSRNFVLSPFFFTFSNQLQRLPSNVDRGAWGKRALCLIMDHTFMDDEDFEAAILKEKDAIFNYLCLKPSHPITRKEFGGFDKFVKRNLDIWDVWSHPIRKIIYECFERSKEIDALFSIEEIESFIFEVMEYRNIEPFFNTENAVKKIFKRMGVTQTTKTINGEKIKCYIGLKRKDKLPEGCADIFPASTKAPRQTPLIKNPYLAKKKEMETIKLTDIPKAPVVEVTPPTITWQNRDNLIFDQILGLARKYPKQRIEFGDIWEPLANKTTKKEIRTYFQEMKKSGFVEYQQKKGGYVYVGRLV